LLQARDPASGRLDGEGERPGIQRVIEIQKEIDQHDHEHQQDVRDIPESTGLEPDVAAALWSPVRRSVIDY
jgi:hypothetical protein